jgi:hypothetical protein
MAAQQNDGYTGSQQLNTKDGGGYNELSFLMKMALGKLNTSTLVQVEAVHSNGTGAAGTVDVTPLVNQITGDGTAIPHTTIHGLPFLRVQGGANALICDPQVGDVGLCVFADHDISGVKKARGKANPGSKRRFDWADGLYIGGWSKTTALRYLLLSDDGAHLGGPFLDLLTSGSKLKIEGTQVLIKQQTGVGATPPVYSLTGTYSADLANLQLAYNGIVGLMTAMKAHGAVAT